MNMSKEKTMVEAIMRLELFSNECIKRTGFSMSFVELVCEQCGVRHIQRYWLSPMCEDCQCLE
jgi:hypothetical protein